MKKIIFSITYFAAITSAFAQTIAGDYLDLNNVRARINAEGSLFWDLVTYPQFEVPKGSGHITISDDNLWIGGIDAGGTLRIAAQTYRQTGTDFWPGPINSLGVYDTANAFHDNKVWKVNKYNIDSFHNWVTAGSIGACPLDSATIFNIANWPAYASDGSALAPYYDYNGDASYDVNAGDYPLIKGDQAIYFIYNDKAGIHTETGGAPIGLQVQGMAYEYSCPDSALRNTVFIDYKIINKSSSVLYNTYVGKWTDFDMGNDYVGSDVTRGNYYSYHDSTPNYQYGNHQPAQGVVFLKTPYADANGLDDAIVTTANGVGYGDLIVDNEQLGMTYFGSFYTPAPSTYGFPVGSNEYYNYLEGKWKNSSDWTFGGTGDTGSVSCKYLFPGASDPLGYSTMGSPMGNWYEPAILSTKDVRSVGTSGPFTFYPGMVQELEVAYVFGRDYVNTGGAAGITVMNERIDSIKAMYNSGIVACGYDSASAGIHSPQLVSSLSIYPNPASSTITVNYSGSTKNVGIEIYNVTGQLVKSVKTNSLNKLVIDVSDLVDGLYILKLSDGKNNSVQRFIKQ